METGHGRYVPGAAVGALVDPTRGFPRGLMVRSNFDILTRTCAIGSGIAQSRVTKPFRGYSALLINCAGFQVGLQIHRKQQ
jgi:hypothetical protein